MGIKRYLSSTLAITGLAHGGYFMYTGIWMPGVEIREQNRWEEKRTETNYIFCKKVI